MLSNHRICLLALLSAALGAACKSTPAGTSNCAAAPQQSPIGAPCPGFGAPVQTGSIDASNLLEISGIAASRTVPGAFYVHNDSDDGPRFYAIDASGRLLAAFELTGAAAVDYEDIAVGASNGRTFVYIGDTGDNGARDGSVAPRGEIQVYRVPEPNFPRVPDLAQYAIGFERLRLSYPDRPHDSEALLFDSIRSQLILISKEDRGVATVFEVPPDVTPDTPTTLVPRGPVVIGSCNGPTTGVVTGADISPDGRNIVLISYGLISLWQRSVTESVADALGRPAQFTATLGAPNAEAITFAPDGRSWYATTEGANAPLLKATLNCP
ncbi:MAG TPA: hypothetical protein VFQ61_25135 [Polyangiaceae bacterium]|nr:hypothetical protein [Polyangiaceae bacterium]